MIIVYDIVLGLCELDIYIDKRSAVDSYVAAGRSVPLGRDLTDEELDRFQSEYEAEIQDFAYSSSETRNHN